MSFVVAVVVMRRRRGEARVADLNGEQPAALWHETGRYQCAPHERDQQNADRPSARAFSETDLHPTYLQSIRR
jgi:hypothetical protein